MYASGAMVIFGRMFQELAEKETRVITFLDHPRLGSESYALVDVYCVDPACDCRRVMINVIRDRDTKHLATINWAFDEGDPDRGPFLDPLNPQSDLSDELLEMVKDILKHKKYVERLERHYKMVKDAVADPKHQVHQVLKSVSRKGAPYESMAKKRFVGTLSDAELTGVWKEVGLDVPPDLVEETIRRGGRMISYLGPLLVDQDLWASGPESREGWAPAHALKLMSAIGGANVASYAAEFFRRGLGEDWLTDEGDNLILSLGPGGIDPILEVVEDPKADFWGRVIAIDGLAMLGLAHREHQVRLIARFRRLAKPLLEKPLDDVTGDDGQFLITLLEALATLHDAPSRQWLEKAAMEERCAIHPDDLRETLKQFETPFDEILADLRTDPLEHFDPERLTRLKDMHGLNGAGGDEKPHPAPILRKDSKIGRNDPCPCGSGKKYKKCCLSE